MRLEKNTAFKVVGQPVKRSKTKNDEGGKMCEVLKLSKTNIGCFAAISISRLVLMMISAVTLCQLFVSCSKDEEKNTNSPDSVPPSAPEGMLGIEADTEGSSLNMLIMWIPNNETDLAGYNVYRTIGAGNYQKLNTQLIVETSEGLYFLDNSYDENSDQLHSYYVTAMDGSGNESQASEISSLIPSAINQDEFIGGLTPTTGAANVSLNPTFSWSSTEGANSYCIMLQAGGAGSENPMIWIFRASGISFEYGKTTGYTYLPAENEQLTPNTYYRFQILAINNANMVFAWNESYFTTSP